MKNFLAARALSFKAAIKGLIWLSTKELHFKLHLIATVAVIWFGFFKKISATDWLFVVLAAALVLVSEALNSAIERLADFVEPKYHEKIGIIKDISAGAVLISAIVALIIGYIVFFGL